MNAHAIMAKMTLTADELADIQKLVELCNHHDQIDLKVNPDMLQKRSGTHAEDFLCYADGQLVGFLGLYVFHGGEAEVSGMVHPSYRRKGIFTALQVKAAEECQKRNIPKQLFIVQRESTAGKACMEHFGAAYQFSEYWMELEQKERTVAPSAVQLRPAGPEDMEKLIWLNIHGFQMDEDRAREMSLRIESDSNRDTYLILVSEEAIGKISVLRDGGKGFIFGFCVHPDHQGKGYGRKALAQTIQILKEQGYEHVSLEVACENSGALALYESCGFSVKSANDYYQLPL